MRAFGFDGRGRLRPNPAHPPQDLADGLDPSAAWTAIEHLTSLGYISGVEGGYALTVKGIDELDKIKDSRLEP